MVNFVQVTVYLVDHGVIIIDVILSYYCTACGASGALYALVCCVIGCPCLYSCFYRSKMRQQYALRETPCGDCLVHCCCEGCALCQEHRELTMRGYDMTIGKTSKQHCPLSIMLFPDIDFAWKSLEKNLRITDSPKYNLSKFKMDFTWIKTNRWQNLIFCCLSIHGNLSLVLSEID